MQNQVQETKRILALLAQASHSAGVHFVFAPSEELMERIDLRNRSFGNVEVDDDHLFYMCPFADMSIDLRTRTLWIEEERFDYADPKAWVHVLHELAHILASTVNPADSTEYDFFGWEIAVAKRLRAEDAWVKHNSDYLVQIPFAEDQHDRELSSLSADELRMLFAERLTYAAALDLIREQRAVIRNPFTHEVVCLF